MQRWKLASIAFAAGATVHANPSLHLRVRELESLSSPEYDDGYGSSSQSDASGSSFMWFEEGSAVGLSLDDEGDSVDGVGDGYGIDWTNWSWPDDVTPYMWKDAIGPFGQCGGTGYAGNETCIENWVCMQLADAFAECLPVSSVVTGNGTVMVVVPPLPPMTIAPAPTGSSSSGSPSNEPELPAPATPAPTPSSSGSVSNEPEPPAPVMPAPFPSAPAPTATAPVTDPPDASSGSGDHYASQFDKVKPWQQCGGRDFSYAQYGAAVNDDTLRLVCTAGYQCDVINDWFFQCVPVHDPDSVAL